MKRNNWVTCNTPISEYRVDSKGIHYIRTIYPGGKPGEHPKLVGPDDPKPRNGEDKDKKSD